MKFIQTITGRIKPEEMGVTYCHDHIMFMPPPHISEKDLTLRLDDVEKSLKEMQIFKIAGGSCVIEMSTIDAGRSPDEMRTISEQSGIKIVAATGFNKNIFCESIIKDQSIDQIASNMINDLIEGMDGGSIKAGVIKASSSKDIFTESEEKVFKAAAIAYKETGAPVSTHTEAGTLALEQIKKLTKDGVNTNNIVIGHLDRKLEWDYLKEVADTGVFMSFDQLSKEKYYPDALRIEMIKKLIENGYGDQIMLAGDLARKSYLPSYGFGYGPGYTYILWRFVPWMLEEGISRESIEKMLVSNPAKAFVWKE